MFLADQNTEIPGGTMPVGYPVDGVDVLVLDEAGQEVSPGGTGEIAVRSRYLAQGYWQDPEHTRMKFLPDPDGKNERIYLTGDLGRKLPDGCLIHMGRKDFEVKIRGNKVNLSAVEAALRGLDTIAEAALVPRENNLGNTDLLAYVTSASQTALTVSELRRALSQTLPDYRIPSTFVFLNQLPLLPNGKVNRQALPAPTAARPLLDIPFTAPRTPVEEKLAMIWAEVLDLDEIGVDDNFLELGGDSLRAGQVISRVINAFRVELALRSLFEAPTVAEMALVITQSQAHNADQGQVERMLAELESLASLESSHLLDEESEPIRTDRRDT